MRNDSIAGIKYLQKSLDADDGHVINVRCWLPEDSPVRGTVQILHGLAEHCGRYLRFAEHLVNNGFAVVTHDHRGHGSRRASDVIGHFADKDGWRKVLDDVQQAREWTANQFPNAPRVLFGHSMGSYIAQNFCMQHPDACDALILSGSTLAPRLQLYPGRFAARLEMLLRGRRHPSASLNKQAFGAFNKRFEPARTDFDWLSRDAAEVDQYVADPACGFLPSAGLWHDLLGGLLIIGKKRKVQKIPADLPILITGGGEDPVGGRRGMERLAALYRKTGHTNVTLQIFDGGRHEMLNETNRDEFTAYATNWSKTSLSL